MQHPDESEARHFLERLSPGLARSALVCPLCGGAAPARGLRARNCPPPSTEVLWQVVFTCPSCGLISAFDAEKTSPRQLRAFHGSSWRQELSQFKWSSPLEEIAHEREATPHHFLGVFVISFLVWLTLTGSFNPVELLWGLAVSLAIARFSYRLVAFNLPRWIFRPRRWLPFLDLLIEFNRQLIIQNVTLSLRVLRPGLPIRPGIVAVPTKLRQDVNLTILGALMTLTPDTVAIDFDSRDGLIYVHWIDVKSTDPEEARRLISEDLEERIIRWLL
jgi:multicomponent Na+:H+ antiporter subunit E